MFAHFLAEYAAGRTPNPDVLCNREIKFKHFLDAARELGAEFIATGHYARVERDGDRVPLLRARDRGKDQSYFLHQLGQAQLAATRFPLGELLKDDVRRMAREAALPTHAKKDSTGICFIGERDFREFLSRYLPAKTGEIAGSARARRRRASGRVLFHPRPARGTAASAACAGAKRRPWYVVGKDVARNVLVVDQGSDSPFLLSTHAAFANRRTGLPAHPPARHFECAAQTRYRQQEEPCAVTVDDDGGLQVRFARPQRAVTPGPVAGAVRRRCLPRRRGDRDHRRPARAQQRARTPGSRHMRIRPHE